MNKRHSNNKFLTIDMTNYTANNFENQKWLIWYIFIPIRNKN